MLHKYNIEIVSVTMKKMKDNILTVHLTGNLFAHCIDRAALLRLPSFYPLGYLPSDENIGERSGGKCGVKFDMQENILEI